MVKRARIRIMGVVQGVGFRPFVYSLALSSLLKGWVRNDTSGVVIEVEGEEGRINQFILRLKEDAPPLAKIERVESSFLLPVGYKNFLIKESETLEEKFVLVSPDISICRDCFRELFDPQNRRYRYPFVNCTNCGPRFTIIKDIPYDRPKTTMAPFKMCPPCQGEYDDPANRRFHAQPNACPDCGPSLKLLDRGGRMVGDSDPIIEVQELLRRGKIVAVKGLGGYHLACDAENEEAVSTLRLRKFREDKPFAIMSSRIEKIKTYCEVTEEEERLLLSPQRPIVLLRKKENCPIAEAVAPQNRYLGVMLPYTPLHYLLLKDSFLALVMTSGNLSDEPIAYKDDDAYTRLSNITDYFLIHNREIYRRCDDSVTRVIKRREYILRRSRGYAPYPIHLKVRLKEILACGAELKNTFCLTKDNYAFLSHHIGDLENIETLNSFEEGIEHFKRLFYLDPKIVAYDLHPDYLSTKYALSLEGITKMGVQHHHAHIASCMAENELEGKAIGIAFDGTGYGLDGKIWGGEFLVATYSDFKRVGYFKYLPMPGGAMAIKEPWRMAASYLYSIYGNDFLKLGIDFNKRLKVASWEILKKAIDRKINTPLTSSMGRLFDAVSSLLGVRDRVNYEGQAAIELEQLARIEYYQEMYGFRWQEDGGVITIDASPVIEGIIDDLQRGESKSLIAAKFHRAVVEMIAGVCKELREDEGLDRVILSGGVFQNILVLEGAIDRLKEDGFQVYIHHRVPCNDGGIALGQAVIANERS